MCRSKPSSIHHNEDYSKYQFEIDNEYQIGQGQSFKGLTKQENNYRRATTKDVNQYSTASSRVRFHNEDSYLNPTKEAENIVHSVNSSNSDSTPPTDCACNNIEKNTEDLIEDTEKIVYSEFSNQCSGVSKSSISNNDYYISESKKARKRTNKLKKTQIYKTKDHNTKRYITKTGVRNSHYGSTRKTRKENLRPRPEIEKVKVPRSNVCALSECFIGSEESAFSIRSEEAWKRRKKKGRSSNYRNMKGWQRSIKEVWKRRKRKKRSSRYGNIEAWQRRKKKYNIQNCVSGSRATLRECILTPEA